MNTLICVVGYLFWVTAAMAMLLMPGYVLAVLVSALIAAWICHKIKR